MARKLPKFIDKKEFELLHSEAVKMERAASKKRSPRIRQYRVAMILAFEAGMRISEILGYKDRVPKLTKDRVEDARIRIESGKGSKDRIVPRPKRINENARNMLPLTIDRRPLQRFVTELGKGVLNKHITFHTLRHGFVTHLIEMGRPIHEVQMLAGHSRLDTTGVYLHANPTKAIEGARDVF